MPSKLVIGRAHWARTPAAYCFTSLQLDAFLPFGTVLQEAFEDAKKVLVVGLAEAAVTVQFLRHLLQMLVLVLLHQQDVELEEPSEEDRLRGQILKVRKERDEV